MIKSCIQQKCKQQKEKCIYTFPVLHTHNKMLIFTANVVMLCRTYLP